MSKDKIEKLKKKIHELELQLHRKNVQLDALHWVWCSGGCTEGMHRWVPAQLTEEMVIEAEANTRRIREWFNNAEFRKVWETLTPAQRADYLSSR